MELNIIKLWCVLIVISNVYGELSPNAIKKILQAYSTNINLSISLSKTDKGLLSAWSDEFQIKRVNITTRFRVQMMKHKDHSFRRSAFDKKWIKCLDIYSADIDASEHMYYENESDCLKTVNAEDADKRKGLKQLEREIKRWRKSYKYLIHLCDTNYPDDAKKAGACLVEYIERDGYNNTLQRLIMMKIEAMGELYLKLTTSMIFLEECLNVNLSSYLDTVRVVMDSLNRCYKGIKKDTDEY